MLKETAMPLSEIQIFVALATALVTGIFALRLGTELYK
uniref:Photosystem I reaction center subunit XII n=1 Tax=Chlorokybus atmophyticus TaxID=3144 RepID=Q19V95_CHLAT|nr:M polypeptide of photosystem I [Chlorokybus atmophyticus]ABD62210.2 M polypeptide of photosystem I [Chlorokybus atmophyticus]WKT05697.1 M polypeptide of photosystem I [Chlorokybus atmophyticus]